MENGNYAAQPQIVQPSMKQTPIGYGQQQPPPVYVQTPANGQQTMYGQQQPNYGQLGYGQQQYGQLHPQVTFAQNQGPTVVIVNPRQPPSTSQQSPRTEWTMPTAKGPGIIMIVIAVMNLAAFIGIGLTSEWYPEFIIDTFLFVIPGILGVVGAKPQRSQGVAIGCLVMSAIALTAAFAQIINRGLGITYGQVLVFWGFEVIGQTMIWVSVALLLVAFLTFGISIALIVIPSKLLCCGAPVQPTRGVVLSHPPQQTTVSHIS